MELKHVCGRLHRNADLLADAGSTANLRTRVEVLQLSAAVNVSFGYGSLATWLTATGLKTDLQKLKRHTGYQNNIGVGGALTRSHHGACATTYLFELLMADGLGHQTQLVRVPSWWFIGI